MTLGVVQNISAQTVRGYPGGFDDCGLIGRGVGTVEGVIARGMGAGFENKQIAVADAIDTAMC